MGVMEIVMGIIVILVAVVLVGLVLLQSGKDKRLSGTIAGAAETFFAKGKSKTRDKMLARATTVLSFVFVILVVVLYIMVA
ncbi:MAG: preprotein translocase subunit SecG [Clostridia bacterium]|nr:preprotein translocase subunit SecG [Clostridia bacterium]